MRIIPAYVLLFFISTLSVYSQDLPREKFNFIRETSNNSSASKNSGGILCPPSIPLIAKDSLVYVTSSTTSYPSGSTLNCLTRSLYLYANSSSIIDTIVSINTPTLEIMFNSYQTSLRSFGTVTLYEGSLNLGCVGASGCSFPIGGPVAPAAGTLWELFFNQLSPNQPHTFVFSKTSAISSTNITIKTPWLNTPLNTFIWNGSTASSYSVIIPANTKIGTASFAISPTVSAGAFQNSNYGLCKISPRQMPLGTYTVTYTFSDTVCTGKTASYIFTVGTPNVNWTAPSVCVGSCPTLTPSTSAVPGGIWSGTGVSGTTFCGSSTGSYNVVYTVGTGTCSNIQTHPISVYNYPSLTANIPGGFCSGTSAPVSVSGASIYNWSPSTGLNTTTAANVIANPTVSITYTVGGIANGCSSSVLVPITVYPKPVANFSVNPQPTTIINSTINFTDLSSGATLTNWTWNFGDGNSDINQNPANTYATVGQFTASLIVTSNNNCKDTSYFTIDIGADHVNLYNSFSPNGDGLNDIFEIDYIDQFPKNHVYVYNRWGQLLWDKQGYNNASVVWDGKDNKGTQLGAGTYFYIIEIDGKKTEKHWVELTK